MDIKTLIKLIFFVITICIIIYVRMTKIPVLCLACEETGTFTRCITGTGNGTQTCAAYKLQRKIIDDINIVKLPKEIKSLIGDKTFEGRHAKAYLKKRGIIDEDIIKYNIGYSTNGRYNDSVIIPSYNSEYKLNYFISRKIVDSNRKYDSPKCDKNAIIGLESNVNWKTPIILCEGIFDAIAIKRNVIPLFGKTIPKALMMKLVETNVKTVYVALDRDALKDALKYAEELLNLGKDVYLVDLDDKDPSEMGFDKFTSLVHKAEQLTLSELIYKKIELS